MAQDKEPKKKTIKVSNMYGRARRIEFAKKCVAVVAIIVVAVLLIYVLTHLFNDEDKNVNFYYLKQHMEEKGFNCEMLHEPGGKCTKFNKKFGYTFIRNTNGFEYIVRNSAYTLTIRHGSDQESKINFKTTTDAFPGYKSKNYNCSYKDNVIGGLGECIEVDDNTQLDLEAYVNVIEIAIRDLNEMIDASGYSKKDLLERNIWSKR